MGSPTMGQLLEWLGVLSVVTFLVSLVSVPWLILCLKSDFFIEQHFAPSGNLSRHPLVRVLLLLLRNIIGGALLVAGAAMLFLPGQGLITILIGLSIMMFPGKDFLFEKLVQNLKIQKSLNWIRRKGHKPLFRFTSNLTDDTKY